MRFEHRPFSASKNLIYRWLASPWGERYANLLPHRRHRTRRGGRRTPAAHIPERISIRERPRTGLRDYEGDTIVSRESRAAIVTIHNPRTLYTDARWVLDLSPERVARMFKTMLRKVRSRSLTLDNGLENRAHRRIGIPTYFCAPYRSWEKPGIENANKLIRRFVPKGTDLARVSPRRLRGIIAHLNHLPRRKLGWMTPLEVMARQRLFKTKNPRGRGDALRG